jgi:hypothetical protein
MSCKYLQQSRVPSCRASVRLMSPSVFEQLVFCHGEHRKCPVFREREAGALARKALAMEAAPRKTGLSATKAGRA